MEYRIGVSSSNAYLYQCIHDCTQRQKLSTLVCVCVSCRMCRSMFGRTADKLMDIRGACSSLEFDWRSAGAWGCVLKPPPLFGERATHHADEGSFRATRAVVGCVPRTRTFSLVLSTHTYIYRNIQREREREQIVRWFASTLCDSVRIARL